MKKWLILIMTILLCPAFGARADLVSKTITYDQAGQKLKGYLAYDSKITGKRPGVLVVHEWWGLNQYARKRADQLAELGYVAFALDMYGEGRTTNHPQEASQWSREITQNIELWQKRALAGLKVLQEQPQTDTARIAAIGYCFGGGTVQQLAYSGAPLKGVVSFHGPLQMPPQDAARNVKAAIMIAQGGADPFVTPEQTRDYLADMEKEKLDYQLLIFGGARHSFTNPNAGQYKMPQLQYNAAADRRSWNYMQVFFKEIFSPRP